ncbi:unnamed protein product [Clonostachys chloroleuca]|uniref:Major facilitator superfamily (MFS) profile domain-containing protein n=1 Tax=Clonostachys chloroleuca TaxID=1926264 RepID=A0AA35Q5J5_9HYPO|nr:unnamed protein product [Clonostachys chloroleuca]
MPVQVLPDNPQPWYRVPHLVKLNLCILIPLLSSCGIGYDGSMMNGLQTLPQWKQYFDNPTGAMLGAMNAVYPAGKIVALFLVTYLSDRFGRKKVMLIGAFFCVVMPFLQAFAPNAATFIASRALIGVSTSFLSQPSPVLITEIAYPTHRGKLTALFNTSFYLGGIIAAWCTFGTFKIPSPWSWRIPSLLQGLVPFIQLLFIYFVPESPRWLVAQGRLAEARNFFIKYHAGGDENSPLVEFEIDEVETAITLEADTFSQHSWFDLVRGRANRKRLLIIFVIGWFAQWNGVGLISYYIGLILNTIGITEVKDQTLINALLNVSNWIGAVFVGAMMVDRLGRRTLYLLSTCWMLVCYAIWTGLTSHFIATKNTAVGKGVVAFVFFTYFGYSIAWAPLLQAYTVELYPYTLRGRGLSALYLFSFSGLVLANQVNPIAMAALGWKYYIVFCCILFVLVFVIWFLFPETRGHTLEEIRQLFDHDLQDTANAKLPGEKVCEQDTSEKVTLQQVERKVEV